MRHPPAPGRWLNSRAETRAVALVLHGMNTRPARMEPIARLLNRHGVDCLVGVLPGHDGDLGELKRATRHSLLQGAALAYRRAAARSSELRVPLFFVGYSMGALLGNDLANSVPGVGFDRMLLLAPAFTPVKTAVLLRPLAPFRRLIMPSSLPEHYRVHPGTPMAVYTALLDSAAALRRSDLAGSRVPTLIFADPRDQLISTPRLKKMIKRRALRSWRLIEVQSYLCKSHLLIDAESVGIAQWRHMAGAIEAFVRTDGPCLQPAPSCRQKALG